MTFLELQNAVLARFEQSERDNVKRWLNLFYGQVWALERWSFRLGQAYVSVTPGSTAIGLLPDDTGQVTGLLNGRGERLTPLPPDVWNDLYRAMALQAQTGLPEAYTIINGVPQVGPPSSEDSTSYRLEYFKRLTQLAEDDDEPATPDEFDWMLVAGASAIGQTHTQDPTAALQDPVILRALDSMRRDFLTDLRVSEQWGKC